jgi:hypothetical protein
MKMGLNKGQTRYKRAKNENKFDDKRAKGGER